jgi:hypothetical protein
MSIVRTRRTACILSFIILLVVLITSIQKSNTESVPCEYSDYLIDMARSVKRAGGRLNVAGIAMPGSSLSRRIRQILEGGSVPHISQTQMASVVVARAITCTAPLARWMKPGRTLPRSERAMVQREPASAPNTVIKFVLRDLKIEGDVHDQDGVKDRIVKAWRDREYDNAKDLANAVMEVGIRGDLQDRGYFRAVAQDPVLQPLGLLDGERIGRLDRDAPYDTRSLVTLERHGSSFYRRYSSQNA